MLLSVWSVVVLCNYTNLYFFCFCNMSILFCAVKKALIKTKKSKRYFNYTRTISSNIFSIFSIFASTLFSLSKLQNVKLEKSQITFSKMELWKYHWNSFENDHALNFFISKIQRFELFLLWGLWWHTFLIDFRGNLRNQLPFCDATTVFPAKSLRGNDRRKSILMTCHYPHLVSASDWLKQITLPRRPIKFAFQT